MDEPRRALYVVYGMPSVYNSALVFARRLADAGVDVTVVCDQDISVLAERASVSFEHLSSVTLQSGRSRYRKIVQQARGGPESERDQVGEDERTSEGAQDKPGSLWNRYLRGLLDLWRLRQDSLHDDELVHLIEALNPNLLLIDIECHYAIIASQPLSIPTALCTRLFDHRPAPGIPPLHSHLAPSDEPLERFRIRSAWWALRVRSAGLAFRQALSKQRLMPVHYRSFLLPDVRAIARAKGVKLGAIATRAHWFRPVTYTHAPILSMTLPELDLPRDASVGFDYIGPMIDKRDYAFHGSKVEQEQLNEFINRAKQEERPIVYCSIGTYADCVPGFLDGARALALMRDDFAFIVALGGRKGGRASSLSTEDFPRNVLLLGAAPQLHCLEHARAAILHAGISSLQEALLFRVPVLCVSGESNDQNGTAMRWLRRGLARPLLAADFTGARLSRELDALLADGEMVRRIEREGQRLDACMANFSAANLFNRLCN